jgi:hypothetical protein
MPLPQFNRAGELPEGVHQATIDEVIAQFGSGTSQRQAVTARLQRIYHLAHATRQLERLILFGSYITTKPAPNDVDNRVVPSYKDEVRYTPKNNGGSFPMGLHIRDERQLKALTGLYIVSPPRPSAATRAVHPSWPYRHREPGTRARAGGTSGGWRKRPFEFPIHTAAIVYLNCVASSLC